MSKEPASFDPTMLILDCFFLSCLLSSYLWHLWALPVRVRAFSEVNTNETQPSIPRVSLSLLGWMCMLGLIMLLLCPMLLTWAQCVGVKYKVIPDSADLSLF